MYPLLNDLEEIYWQCYRMQKGSQQSKCSKLRRSLIFLRAQFFPPENGNICKIRIFTPTTTEVPFAGHPNIGTVFVLASAGIVEEFYVTTEIVFEEKAGLVPITLRKLHDGVIWRELLDPEIFSIGKIVSTERLSFAISPTPGKISTNIHFPLIFSVGLPFLIAELTDRGALDDVSVNPEGFKKLVAQYITLYVHVYSQSNDEFDIRSLLFAPFEGMPEDPATGSANCALGG